MDKLLGVLSALRERGIDDLSPVDLKAKVTVAQAADLNTISEDTFRKKYSHLIKQVSARRQAVTLGDAINLPPPPGEAAE
jgi:hypothetical protein